MRHRFELASLFTLLAIAGAGCAVEPGAPPARGGASAEAPGAVEEANPTLANLDPATRAFVEGLAARGGAPLYERSFAEARSFLVNLQAEHAPAIPIPANIEDQVLPVGPTGTVPVRIVKPVGAVAALPVVVYFHGGGWILGDETTHDRLIRTLAALAGAAVVFVKYTPSPEAQFPVPLQQAFEATKYIAENGVRFGLDASRLAVAGDSVGGNFATVVAMLAKQQHGPAIRCQVLLYPVTDARMDTASYQQFANGPWLTRKAMEWFFDAYAPKADTREQPYVSPLRATTEELRGLPPALVITDENDVLRDEGEAYAHALMAADVPVRAVRYLGTIHDFMMLNALAGTPASRGATQQAGITLRAVLSR